jgi:hypothetical protein
VEGSLGLMLFSDTLGKKTADGPTSDPKNKNFRAKFRRRSPIPRPLMPASYATQWNNQGFMASISGQAIGSEPIGMIRSVVLA